MDQKTPLHDEQPVRFAYFARRNPAIHRLSVTSNHPRKFRYGEVLTGGGSGFGFLPAHDRLSSPYSNALLSMSLCQLGGEGYRNLDTRPEICRTAGFSYIPILKKCAMCGFGTHTLLTECYNDVVRSSYVGFSRSRLRFCGPSIGVPQMS
jgi:hypothetical protein